MSWGGLWLIMKTMQNGNFSCSTPNATTCDRQRSDRVLRAKRAKFHSFWAVKKIFISSKKNFTVLSLQCTTNNDLQWYFSGLKNVCYDLSNFALFFVQWPKKPAAQSCGLKNRLVDHGTFARPCGKSQCLSPLRWENKSYFGKGLGGSETTL